MTLWGPRPSTTSLTKVGLMVLIKSTSREDEEDLTKTSALVVGQRQSKPSSATSLTRWSWCCSASKTRSIPSKPLCSCRRPAWTWSAGGSRLEYTSSACRRWRSVGASRLSLLWWWGYWRWFWFPDHCPRVLFSRPNQKSSLTGQPLILKNRVVVLESGLVEDQTDWEF